MTTTSFGQFDILTGRGGRVNGHSGNRVFQRLVDHHKAKYASLERKQDKAWLIQSVLEAIKCEGARFMKQDEFGNWHELDHNEAFKKTGQAFREPCFHTRKPAATIEIEPSHAVSAEVHESNSQFLFSVADYYKQPRRHSCRLRPAPDGQGGKCERVDFTKMACERIGVFTGVCLDCHREQHAPASCDQFDKWLQECKAESETAHWILANTKECPNCHVRIENNNQQGYRFRHTTCVHCRHAFCWLCGEDCTEDGDGRKIDISHADINEGSIKVAPDAPPSSSSSDVMVAKKTPHDLSGMNRYVHYYQRFCAQAQEQTLAEQHWEEVKQMEQSMARSNHASWADLQLSVTQAKELLVDCHRVLKFANVLAYYTPNSRSEPAKHHQQALLLAREDLFENYQEMLKRFTNELFELSGKPLYQMDRMELVNKAEAVDRFMKNMLKWVKDGMMDVMNEDDGVRDQVMDGGWKDVEKTK